MHYLGAWVEESKYLIPSILPILYNNLFKKRYYNSLNISSSETVTKKNDTDFLINPVGGP